MWHDTYSPKNMVGWDGSWDWLMSFHGFFTIISLAIIVFVGIVIYLDWQRDQFDGPGMGNTKHE